jgi:CRP-like cAMP-binding protein
MSFISNFLLYNDTMEPSIPFLQRVDLFQNLPESALAELAASSQPRMVEEGGFFFMQGDEARHMYVLTQGRVKLTQVSLDGQQVGMRMVVPPQMFAGIALLNPKKGYPVSAEAMEDSAALAWDGDDLRRLADQYPTLSFGIMNVMRGYIEEMQSRFRELATERVERRVARALLRLTTQTGTKLENGGIEIFLSRQDVAEMSGTTLFSVSRILSEWERQGLIETGRGRLVIRRPHGLVSIAEDLSG